MIALTPDGRVDVLVAIGVIAAYVVARRVVLRVSKATRELKRRQHG